MATQKIVPMTSPKILSKTLFGNKERGEGSRFAFIEMLTRFNEPEYFITDAEKPDLLTRLPSTIFQSRDLQAALSKQTALLA